MCPKLKPSLVPVVTPLPATCLLPAQGWTSELCFVCKVMSVGKIAQVCSEPWSGFLRARVCPRELCVRISYWGGTCVGSVWSQVCSAKHYWHHKPTLATYLWAILAVSAISVVKRSDCCSTTCPLLERTAFSFTVAAFAQRNRTDTSLCPRHVSSCCR